MSISLETLGFGPELRAAVEAAGEPELVPARVAIEYRDSYWVIGADGEVMAEASGRLHHDAQSRLDLPAVGDWVLLRPGSGGGAPLVVAVLPRKSRLVRKAAGKRGTPQIVAANLDVVFIVSSLNQDFNPRRIERYRSAVIDGGAEPVLVLNKSDLGVDEEALRAELGPVAQVTPLAIVSAKEQRGKESLAPFLAPGRTVAFVGSSGVGKSSLINWLLGVERQTIGEIRSHDERGKHITTRRELLVMPGGAVLIDTPGMREFEPWGAEEGIGQVFNDVEAIAGDCRFSDCAHESEPGCAVREALERGELAAERFEQYRKLLGEQRAQAAREDPLLRKRMREEFQKKVRDMGERHRLERGEGKGRKR